MARWSLGVIGVVLLTHLVTVALVGAAEPGWVARRLHMDHEYGIPAAVSALMLLGSAIVALRLSRVDAPADGGRERRWLVVAVAMAYVAVDEALVLHEMAIGLPSRWWDVPDFLALDWVLLALPIVVLLAAVLLPWVLRQPPWLRTRMLLSGALFVGGAVGVETLAGQLDRVSLAFQALSTIEETLEMAGAALFLTTLVRRHQELTGAT